METKFNFNSAICTSRSQSERLLALGLKKETADMWYPHFAPTFPIPLTEDDNFSKDDISAWSLHRLIEMADSTKMGEEYREDDNELWFAMDRCYCWNNHEAFYSYNLYDSLINCIEWLIKEGFFNKEYLEEKL